MLQFPFNMNFKESKLLWLGCPTSLVLLHKTSFTVMKCGHSKTRKLHMLKLNAFYSAGGQIENSPTSNRTEYKSQGIQKLILCLGCFCFSVGLGRAVHGLMSQT